MQCPSCQFRNMPGSGRCARCGAMLALATAEINVHPPRATSWQKKTRTWRLRILAQQVWRSIGQIVPGRPAAKLPSLPLGTLLRGLVPGWANLHAGQRLWGWAILGSFLTFLVPALLLWGTSASVILLGLAIAVHVVSLQTAVAIHGGDVQSRTIIALGCCAVVFVLIYLPGILLLSRTINPFTINQAVPPFEAGSVVWVRNADPFRPGRLVLYQGRQQSIPVSGVQYPIALVMGGPRLGNVLAIPQQTVEWRKGRLHIDQRPLPGLMPTSVSHPAWSVPAGHVLVDVTGEIRDDPRYGRPQLSPDAWKTLALISQSNVTGEVYYQVWPISQTGFVQGQ